jgi:hypothetical protein
VTLVHDLAVIAVDWSGARGSGPHSSIWITGYRGTATIVDEGNWSRAAAVAFVTEQEPPVVAGFDFSFGVPVWFARALGCATIDDVWACAAAFEEAWLAPTPPFWRHKCVLPVEQQFRQCEERLRAQGSRPKSLFQLVGNGQVGAGSVRGMPLLARMRSAGFAIWPFDKPSDRLVVEIYPSLLRRLFPQLRDPSPPTPDARDARVSARAMQARAEEFAQLGEAVDPVVRLEGSVWLPATSP